jgi:prevent-host-death family protein
MVYFTQDTPMQIGITQARGQLSQLIDRAIAGERIIITRRGVPIAWLKPLTAKEIAAEHNANIGRKA